MPNLPNETHFLDVDPLPLDQRDLWLKRTVIEVSTGLRSKFIIGQAEHGCDLGKVCVLRLLDEMENEAIDQLMYIQELKRRYTGTTTTN